MIPFRFTNVSTIFQKYINKILAEKLDIFVIVYLDNILIYTENKRESYVKVIQYILDQLQKYLLYTKLKKYYFH